MVKMVRSIAGRKRKLRVLCADVWCDLSGLVFASLLKFVTKRDGQLVLLMRVRVCVRVRVVLSKKRRGNRMMSSSSCQWPTLVCC